MITDLEIAGIQYKEFNNGKQINALDKEGIWQIFYPTTGTIVIHSSNDKYHHQSRTFRDKTLSNFINCLKFEGLANYYFKEEK